MTWVTFLFLGVMEVRSIVPCHFDGVMYLQLLRYSFTNTQSSLIMMR